MRGRRHVTDVGRNNAGSILQNGTGFNILDYFQTAKKCNSKSYYMSCLMHQSIAIKNGEGKAKQLFLRSSQGLHIYYNFLESMLTVSRNCNFSSVNLYNTLRLMTTIPQ